ncbi:MCE family protein [Nocardioides nematodiphilus]|uniref:MCE family protein n=1 Tax=Nocardioides nematodiphilus TaxID=2849669 RepID=UPI001CD9A133|nr:MCE family protein [Nocardioides nematodiphilus]MCA1982151.1 MCE family protein [Nocardioides nematodiphilus]
MTGLSSRNMVTATAAVKLGIFTLTSVIVTGMLAIIMGHLGGGGQHTYSAIFTSASELKKGDDVRVAGVSVGSVRDVQLYDGDQAKVTFRVENGVPMTTASGAQIRYLNLVGARYLALTQSSTADAGAKGAPLKPGATIPVAQTTPALNLTELFNGFQPLFQALNPQDVNDLSLNLIKVLQGEGGTIASVLQQTASLTSTLADRDQLIGDVITNLSATLKTVDDHHTQLSQLLTQLSGWMGDLARDKTTIGDSVHQIGDLSGQLATLLTDVRPATKTDIAQLRRIVTTLNKPENQALMDDTLKRLPKTLQAQVRIGTYGSSYNYYLCDLDVVIKLPSLGKILDDSPVIKALQKALSSVAVYSTAKRCDA